MNLKILGVAGFVAVIGLASVTIYGLLNLGGYGFQEIETCDISCTSNVTNERFEEMRAELKQEYPGYNLSRTGEKVHCPCTNSTKLKYEIYHRGVDAGRLIHENGETEINVVR